MPKDLAALLVEDGAVPADVVERAVARQREAGGTLDTALLELGALREDVLASALARAAELPQAPSAAWQAADARARRVFPSRVAERHGLAPFALDGRELSLVATYPVDLGLLDEISFMLSLHLTAHVGPEWRVRELIHRIYGTPLSPRLVAVADAVRAAGAPEAAPRPAPAPGRPEEPAQPDAREPTGIDAGDEAGAGGGDAHARAVDARREDEAGERASPRAPPVPGFGGFGTSDEPMEPLAAALAEALENVDLSEYEEAPSPDDASAAPEGTAAEAEPEHEEPEEPPGPPDRSAPPRWTLADARAAAGAARHRDEVVLTALRYARDFFEFAAMFAVTRDAVAGHDALGDEEARDRARSVGIWASDPGVFRTVIETQSPYLGPVQAGAAGTEAVLKGLGRTPRTVLVYPIVLRGRPVCILYADNGEAPVSARRLGDLLLFLSTVGATFERIIRDRKKRRRRRSVRAPASPPEAPADAPVAGVFAAERRAEGQPELLASSGPAASGSPAPAAAIREEPAPALAEAPRRDQGSPDAERGLEAASPGTPAREPAAQPPAEEPPAAAGRVPLSEDERDEGNLSFASLEAAGEAERTPAATPEPEPSSKQRPPAQHPQPALRPQPEPPRDQQPEGTEQRSPHGPRVAPLPLRPPAASPVHRVPLPTDPGRTAIIWPAAPAPPGEAEADPWEAAQQAARTAPDAKRDRDADHGAGPGARAEVPAGAAEAVTSVEVPPAAPHGPHAPAPAAPPVSPGPAAAPPRAAAAGVPASVPATPTRAEPPGAAPVAPVHAEPAGAAPAPPRQEAPGSHAARPDVRAPPVAAPPDPGALTALADRALDADPEVAATACAALGTRRRDPALRAAAEKLRRALLSGIAARAQRAARALAALRDPEAIPLLIQVLETSDPETANVAAAALSAVTLQRLGPDARRWLAWWKENRGRGRAQWLFSALTSPDRELRVAASLELSQAAPSPVVYTADMPAPERENAARTWAGWWARSGHVL